MDGATGAPIARARVRIQSGPAAPRKEILTNGNGAFVFAELPPGRYTLAIEESSYLPTQFPDFGRSLRTMPLIVQDDHTAEITVPLHRGGAIAGQVMDAHGDPVENARVTALWSPRSGRPMFRNSTQTNNLGEFRIGNLAAGRYLIHLRPEVRSSGPSGRLMAVSLVFPPTVSSSRRRRPGSFSRREWSATAGPRGNTSSLPMASGF